MARDVPEVAKGTRVFGECVDHYAREEETTVNVARGFSIAETRADFDEAWKRPTVATRRLVDAKAKAIRESLSRSRAGRADGTCPQE